MSEFKNEIKSDIQKKILEKNKERNEQPRRGVLNNLQSFDEDKFFFNFVNGAPILEIHGISTMKYEVKFYDAKSGQVLKMHENVTVGEWVQADQEYFVAWIISVKDEDGIVKNFAIDLKDKLVFVTFESSALGDTIAWMPIVEEFRKKYGVKVVCSSFHNNLFKDIYPDITFVEKGTPIEGMNFAFRLGWFGDGKANTRNKFDCQTRNLQQLAMDTLGLDYLELGEVRPKLQGSKKGRLLKKKYVAITTCSTAQFKYWNHPNGWQEIVNHLRKKGYEVVNIGKSPNFLHDVINYTGQRDMDDLFNIIQYSEFFIGLASGLSWLSWGLGKKTIMITGITEPFVEFQEDMYRVENINACKSKCFSDTSFLFDKGNWVWCPLHENTQEHFTCTKSITPDMVKKKISLVETHIKEKINVILDTDGNLTSKKTSKVICKYGE